MKKQEFAPFSAKQTAALCWWVDGSPYSGCAVMDYAFRELDIVVMAICTGPENKRSQRVIEKCGFRFEGIQRKGYHIYDGTDRDNVVYSILKEEFLDREKE